VAAPEPLRRHAETTAQVLAAARAKLGDPKAATPARPARKVDESLRGSHRVAAVALLDAADEAVWAAEEASRHELAIDDELVKFSARLRDSALALSRALGLSGEEAAALLVEAKKQASVAELHHRSQRKKAHDDPRFVDGLKREGVAKRLSDCGEALQKAIDAAAEALAS